MSLRPNTVTIVSNGHGEDVIGAALAAALLRLEPTLSLRAFPLVDAGEPYAAMGVARLGPQRALPSGGFMMHSWAYFQADLRAGYLGLTLQQLRALATTRSDVLVVVGDVYAQALAALSRARFRAVLQPLVSAHHRQPGRSQPPVHRFFMERISYPERALMRHLADVVYLRDEATAAWLRDLGLGQALALGNPMVDRAAGQPLPGLPTGPAIGLLPGTRAHTPAALQRMASAVALLPSAIGLVAWSGGEVPSLEGWLPEPGLPALLGRIAALRRGDSRLWLLEGRFGDVLASVSVVIGTAGTANEQAAARGLPVVSFPLEPHYTPAYLANQQRLLGAALAVVEGRPPAIAAAVQAFLSDAAARSRAAEDGRRRMGGPGGGLAIAQDLLERCRKRGLLLPPSTLKRSPGPL